VHAYRDDRLRRNGLSRWPVIRLRGVLIELIAMDDLLQLMAEQMSTMALSIQAQRLRERKVRP